MEKCCLSGIVKTEKQQLGMFVKEAEGSKDVVDC